MVVALVTHGLVTAASALFWFRARQFREHELADFGAALPGGTQFFYDCEIPAFIFGALAVSLVAVVLLRSSTSALVLSSLSVVLAAAAMGVGWWMMRLPFS